MGIVLSGMIEPHLEAANEFTQNSWHYLNLKLWLYLSNNLPLSIYLSHQVKNHLISLYNNHCDLVWKNLWFDLFLKNILISF
jgi:hypothetical protein